MSESKMDSSNSTELECKYCEYSTYKSTQLWNHMRTCPAKKRLEKCEICGHLTSDLQIHLYRHLKAPKIEVRKLKGARSFWCKECKFVADSRPRLVAHQTLDHKESKVGQWIVKLDDAIIQEEKATIIWRYFQYKKTGQKCFRPY